MKLFIKKICCFFLIAQLLIFSLSCAEAPSCYLPTTAEYPLASEVLEPVSVKEADDVFFESLPHHSTYAAVYDVNAGKLLYSSNNMNEKMYPASTTKLLSALTALDFVEPTDIFTVGNEVSMIGQGSSVAYVKKSYKLSVEMLIEGMMVPSGNDAAYALAAGVGRIIGGANISDEAAVSLFVDKMNEKAEKLGLYDTHFTSPDGYHDDDHYTTLSDMLELAISACNNDVIMKYCGQKSVYAVYASGQSITWKNTNKLLDPSSNYYYAGVCGLKTGSTDEAGCCLITLFDNGEQRLLVLTFDSPSDDARYQDTILLLNEFVK